MKILLTTDWYYPTVNGVVTSVLNLKKELEALGHDVRVLTLAPSIHSRNQIGVYAIGSLPVGRIYPGARLRSAWAGKQTRALLDWAPDIIHSQCEFSTFHLARKLSKALDVPLVHTYHTVYEDYTHYFSPSERLGKRAVATFTRHIAARTDCLIAPTEKVRALLERYHVGVPVQVIPTGIDLSMFQQPVDLERQSELRVQWGIAPDRPVLVSVGRLAEEKNASELIRCAAALPVTLLLVGDGPYRPQLEREAKESGAHVIFTGMVSPQETVDYYRLGTLFVNASSSEAQGLTYIEALAAGTPALCKADPCLDGIITNGVNGWQYHSEQDFIMKTQAALSHPDLLRMMGRNAAYSACDFSSQRFAQRVEAVYLDVIRQRSRRQGVSA